MRNLIALALVAMLVLMSMPVMAEDGHNFWDRTGDILSGKSESVEIWPYVAYTTKGVTRVKGIPVIPKNLRTKVSTRFAPDIVEDTVYKLEMGLEF